MMFRTTRAGLLLFAILHSTVQAIPRATSTSTSMFWTVTQNYVNELGTTTVEWNGYTDIDTFTSLRSILPGVTPTAEATSSHTYTYDWTDLELVEVYYPPDAVKESELERPREYTASSTRTTVDYASTVFIMPVIYTAPPTCTNDFNYGTTVTVHIPTQVRPHITPTSTATGEPYTYFYGSIPAGDVTWFLEPGAAPWTSTSDYDYRWYIADCTTPPSYSSYTRNHYSDPSDSSSSSSSSRYYDDDDDDDDDYWTCISRWGCPSHSLRFYIILIAALIPSLFVLGIFESYFWFRRLMTGRSALRFGTICWVFISLWVACFTRKQDARSKEDQKVLREKWKAVSVGTALKLWLKWGFRHRYPTELLGPYVRPTVGEVETGQVGGGQGPMVQQQYGPVAVPPPAYVNQEPVGVGAPAAPIGSVASSDQGKDGVTVVVQAKQA